jgi:hypothetical protein
MRTVEQRIRWLEDRFTLPLCTPPPGNSRWIPTPVFGSFVEALRIAPATAHSAPGLQLFYARRA